MMLAADNDELSFSGLARIFANTLLQARLPDDLENLMKPETFRIHKAADYLSTSIQNIADHLGLSAEEAFTCAVYRIAYETHVIPELQDVSIKRADALSAWFRAVPKLDGLSKDAGTALVLANNQLGFDPIAF